MTLELYRQNALNRTESFTQEQFRDETRTLGDPQLHFDRCRNAISQLLRLGLLTRERKDGVYWYLPKK